MTGPSLPQQSDGRICDVFIVTSQDPWAGTYCKRPAGHKGEHYPHFERALESPIPAIALTGKEEPRDA
jgi:hypothetical protein